MNHRELATENSGPLKGVRILDLTGVMFGAYATQILGDQGADVLKVESPSDSAGRGGGGDIIRWNGEVPEGRPRDLGPIFLSVNRNKRSLALDLRKPDELARLKTLIPHCDVFVASVRYEGLKRLGLGYEEVKAVKPDIVYAIASGYGMDGPYAGDPAYDDLIQAQTGLADLLNRTDGDPEHRYLPTLIADKTMGVILSQAITAALFHRERTGEGQFVEVPMFEAMTAYNLAENHFHHVFEPPIGQWGYARVVNPTRKPFQTKDGYIGLLPYTEAQWTSFFEAAGWGESFAKDPRFADHAARNRNIRALYALIGEATKTKTTAEWFALLKPLGIPIVKLNTMDELEDDPHLQAVGLFEHYQHPHAGPYVAVRPAVRFSASPSSIRRHAPRLGEHTQEVLREFASEPER